MSLDKDRLYIPTGIKTQKELWQGFGHTEMKRTAMALGVIVGIEIIISLFYQNLFFTVVSFVIAMAGTVIMVSKDSVTNLSVVDMVKFMIHFAKEQKVYRYQRMKNF
ncbi:MAG: hypothetical protein RR219_09605 [Clostridiales bacterium]